MKIGKSKVFFFIILIAISFFTTCDNPFILGALSDYYRTVNQSHEVKDYLLRRRGGWSADNPVPLRMDIEMSGANWEEMFRAIGESGKYIDLDLSACKPDNYSLKQILDGEGYFDPKKSYDDVGYCYSGIISIVLPEAATDIKGYNTDFTDEGAFKGFDNLRYVTGNNITYIGEYAFQDRRKLYSINFPKVTYIDTGAFIENWELEIINVPNVKIIHILVFFGCTSLKSVSLPKAEIIANRAFNSCNNLESVSMPNIVIIDEESFYLTSLKSITIPASCTEINTTVGSGAFEYCFELTTVIFEGSNCNFSHYAFQNGSEIDTETGNPKNSLWSKYRPLGEGIPGTYIFTPYYGWERQ